MENELYEDGPTPVLLKYARNFSAQLAVYQAIWELVAVSLLVPASEVSKKRFKVTWTTVGPGGSGQSSGFEVPNIGVPYLPEFARPVSPPDTILTDGDLYLNELPSTTLHPGVEKALRLAVACFRQELFVPAVAMLGAASEGAWIELGKALANGHPKDSKSKKIIEDLEDDFVGTGRKINLIAELYSHRDLFGEVEKASGIKLSRVREIAVWAHTVREARNVLHWNVSPTPENTYEKVAVLLMSALPNIGDLEKLRGVASGA